MHSHEKIINEISLLEVFKQCAEEGSELSKACIKLARKIRDKNPTPLTEREILNNITEEVADVMLCIDILLYSGVIDTDEVAKIMIDKEKRWLNRIDESKKKKEIDVMPKVVFTLY